ncbi:hypothetical protein CALCODRAFT_480524 [Calocera cornea HHB12733]|uniref:Uncharacterized protein n=1 Tax=Calocera cornea HHB12733 TaxID=1353952 RepID=A0A165IIS1_9BASI|nr:hypothetical protein CALCODRAFT_480524 [Calocera cornea HHB12733]
MPGGKKLKWKFLHRKHQTDEPDIEAGATPLLALPASSQPDARTVPARAFQLRHHHQPSATNDDDNDEDELGMGRAFGEMAELDDIGGEIGDTDDEDDDEEDRPEEDAEEDTKRAARRKLKGKAVAVERNEEAGPSRRGGYWEVSTADDALETTGDGDGDVPASTRYELAPATVETGESSTKREGGTIAMGLSGTKEKDWDLLRNMMRFELLPAHTKDTRPGAPQVRLDEEDDHLSWDEDQGPGKPSVHRIIRAAGDELDSEEEDTLLLHKTPFTFREATPMVKEIENMRQSEVGLLEGEDVAVGQLTNFETGGLAGRQDMGEWVQGWNRRPSWVRGYCRACCCMPIYRMDCGRITIALLGWIWRGYRWVEKFIFRHPKLCLLIVVLLVVLIVLGPHRCVQIAKALFNMKADLPKGPV